MAKIKLINFFRKGISKILLCFFLSFTIIAEGQPPVNQIPEGLLPPGIDIKNLTPSQLSSLMKDKNVEAGKDKNQELENQADIKKDTSKKENPLKLPYDPTATFGSNIFTNSAVTNLSELSSPPPDYPKWRH